jgi:hypothetical protein
MVLWQDGMASALSQAATLLKSRINQSLISGTLAC